ncbi:MAG: HD domain-containing protein [bacterium]
MTFLKAIEDKGGEVYEVGGTLRDALLQIPHKDKDLLVAKIPMEELVALLSRFGPVQRVGKSFGVLKFRLHRSHSEVDIALPRLERSTGLGHRDFEVEYDPFLPVEKDLGRRDFTINAMARNVKTGEILDPFGGQRDLESKLLRQVFPQAFEEDPLRMLRAVQFAARFGLTIEAETLAAMKKHAPLIETVSPERIIEEIRKLFSAPKPSAGFRIMRETGLLKFIFPDVENMVGVPQPKKKGGDVFEHTLLVLDASRSSPDVERAGDLEVMFSALFHDTGKPATYRVSEDGQNVTFYGHQIISKKITQKWMKKYRASMLGIDPENVATLVDQHMFETKSFYTERAIRRFVNKVGPELIFKLIDLRIADKKGGAYPENLKGILKLKKRIQDELDKKPPFGPKDLALKGADLMKMGFPEGPQIGKILKELVEIVLDDPGENTAEKLSAHVFKRFGKATQEKETAPQTPEKPGAKGDSHDLRTKGKKGKSE